jgi:hypothetical protein
MRKPKVDTAPVASRYAMDHERIIEFSSAAGGGLISFRILDGRLRVEAYRTDDTVDVITPVRDGMRVMRAEVQQRLGLVDTLNWSDESIILSYRNHRAGEGR